MTNTTPEPQRAHAPLWLRLVAFVLLAAPLWAIASLAAAALAADPSTMGAWQLVGALVPAGLIAWLLVRIPRTGFLAAFLVLAWIGGGAALFLGSQSGIWPWLRDTPRSALKTAPTPVEAPPPAPAAAPSPPASSAPQSLPDFPWPPPAASASYVLPRTLFDAKATLGQVTGAIITALERNGYVERSFFRTGDDGVALVTRLERINDDGSPPRDTERWPGAAKSQGAALDLVGLLRGLFYADRGRYRLIVFILQDRPFTQSAEQVSEPEARRWLRSGVNVLPRAIAERPFGDGNCTALIYEFSSDGSTVKVIESQLTGRQHLEKSGVLAALEKAR